VHRGGWNGQWRCTWATGEAACTRRREELNLHLSIPELGGRRRSTCCRLFAPDLAWAQSTWTDQWRQIVAETAKIHLLTLETGSSKPQITRLANSDLQLVVLQSNWDSNMAVQRDWLWNLCEFIRDVEATRACSCALQRRPWTNSVRRDLRRLVAAAIGHIAALQNMWLLVSPVEDTRAEHPDGPIDGVGRAAHA